MTSHFYISAVSAAGLLVIGHCISTLIQDPVDIQWLALAALTLFTGALTIKIPTISAHLSVSETFVFASVLLFGTCAGTITVALEILIAIAVVGLRKRVDPQRLLFNVSSAALSIWLASQAFYATAGIAPLSQHQAQLNTLIIPLAVLSSTYFVLNSGLVAIALSLQQSGSALSIWRTNFLGLAINYYAGASLAALFVSYTRTIDLFALSVIVPLLFVSYLTFKTSLGRIGDATEHVAAMKQLYLSTIETLATAIDAKDQVTHGHIRRVQKVALGLARAIGVRDPQQLQALEAAALLHDTGKLVVPEHILNKPGKLTSGEFEKMKAHASVGADILSSINFPYPVVPIVRHHHESWNGTGYPDGLQGTAIPIGARVLAVVDCFDALTSDRPYRTRMTDAAAMAVVLQRRGTMYDPLIVDAFVREWPALKREIEALQDVHTSLTHASRGDRSSAGGPALTTGTQPARPEPITFLLSNALRSTGADIAIIYGVDREGDRVLSIASLAREGHFADRSLVMPLGLGLTGWVAVNGSSVVNADPALDFGAEQVGDLVRSICVPISVGSEVSGVLSLYSTDQRGFSDEDKGNLEKLVQLLDAEVGALAISSLLTARSESLDRAATVH